MAGARAHSMFLKRPPVAFVVYLLFKRLEHLEDLAELLAGLLCAGTDPHFWSLSFRGRGRLCR